jgi:hypothetical protein
MRDMPILLDGTVPLCREQIAGAKNSALYIGNALTEPYEKIWELGQGHYVKQSNPISKKYNSLCAGCDEYYTYNF